MNRKKLQLVAHDAAWKDDFAVEKARISAAFDDENVVIEHVGSTSIANIAAKPILDIAVLIRKSALDVFSVAVGDLGYEYRGRFDDEDGHFYAVRDEGDVRLCQMHIYTERNADWYSKLKFRDILRANSALAKEYNDYKLKLAAEISSKSEYAAVKDKWLDSFILKITASK
ncbi:MAG TPA: GrpB family protein [Pyrinomonadaceae bacterium]|nr:GrpB family protein [Pyrinomonadaceae bacterium]